MKLTKMAFRIIQTFGKFTRLQRTKRMYYESPQYVDNINYKDFSLRELEVIAGHMNIEYKFNGRKSDLQKKILDNLEGNTIYKKAASINLYRASKYVSKISLENGILDKLYKKFTQS